MSVNIPLHDGTFCHFVASKPLILGMPLPTPVTGIETILPYRRLREAHLKRTTAILPLAGMNR
jgi:hypothetical protein